MKEEDQEIDNLLDNFDFKPITEGLGFHHSLKEKKEVSTSLHEQSKSLKNELETRVKQLEKSRPISNPEKPIHRGDLTPFYEQKDEIKQQSNISLGEESREETEDFLLASMSTRIAAWLLDASLLVTSMAITIVSIFIFAEFPLDSLSEIILNKQVIISFSFILAMYYMFYFIVLDKTSYSTLGKNIMGIKVVKIRENKAPISLFQSLLRVLISMSSVPLLCLPLILDWQSKLSDTQVVIKK